MPANFVQRLGKGNEVARNDPGALMNQLVERMLAVRSWLAPVNRSRIARDWFPVECYVLSVALHRQLLQICWKAFQVLLVRQYGYCLRVKEVVVPKGQQSHEYGHVRLEGRSTEMLVHLMKPVEHGAEVIRTNSDHRRKTNRGIHRVAAADPIPESEHIGGIDTELGHFRRVR